MLRCTIAGLIPLMMSEKYSGYAEEFYLAQKADFDRIMEKKSYYLIRDLPVEIARRILLPEIPGILARQKSNGLWSNSTRVTYDVLSALYHANLLDDLTAGKKLKNVSEHIADKYDHYSLLIKSVIYRQTDEKDICEMSKLIQDIRSLQNENGSWENTMVATVFHMEKLMDLGVRCDDPSVQNGADFIFKQLNFESENTPDTAKSQGPKINSVFSTANSDLEFEATKKFKKEMDPRLVCYRSLGIMQNSLCLKMLVQIGLERDKRVESSLDRTYAVYKKYNSLCSFKIRKKFMAEHKKSRTKDQMM